MPAELTTYSGAPPWLGARRTRVTGTDVPILLGLIPGRDPLTLWAEKRGHIPSQTANERMLAGSAMESVFPELLALRGHTITMYPKWSLLTNPSNPWMAASPDAFGEDKASWSLKTVGLRSQRLWGDNPPAKVVAQLAAELMILGHDEGNVAACFGLAEELPVYRGVMASDELRREILVAAEEFHHYLMTDQPPPIGEHIDKRAERVLSLVLPPGQATITVTADEALAARLRGYGTVRQSLSQANSAVRDYKKAEKSLRLEILRRAGAGAGRVVVVDGTGAELASMSVSSAPKKGYTVAPSVSVKTKLTVYGSPLDDFPDDEEEEN